MSLHRRLDRGAHLGHYELVQKLATGGMAEVWLARTRGARRGLRRMAVVKVILPHLADDPDFVALFHAEAELAARLNHPNIAHFIELGRVEDVPFMSFEFVLGRTLRDIHEAFKAQHRAVPAWFALRVGIDVCQALHHAHEQRDEGGALLGVVHRDVTPENVMVTFSGVTKVVDFGVAKSAVTPRTRAGASATGKLAYLAPEQVIDPGGESVDRRADVYGLGVVLYELLTGVQPIRASNDMTLLLKIPRQKPVPPTQIARWIPTALSATIMSALEKSPDARYQTAEELGRALEHVLPSCDVDPTERQVSSLMCSLYSEEERRLPIFDSEPPAPGAARRAPASSPPLGLADRLKR